MRAGQSDVGIAGPCTSHRSVRLRACLLSTIGHALALGSTALLSYGEGSGNATGKRPELLISVSEQVAPLELEHLTTSFQPDGPEAALEAKAVSHEVAAALGLAWAAPAIGLTGLAGASPANSLDSPLQLTSEIDEKPPAPRRNLGRSASFYGIEADGSKFVFVVDVSGSMSGNRFRRARTELRQTIDNLQPAQSFFVILFNDAPDLMPSLGLAAVNPANVELLDSWLKKIECRGGTNPLPALFAALAMKSDAVFLLSDGKFDRALTQAVSQLEAYQRIPIHTIGFASRKGEPTLRAISQISGGTYRYVR